ncbi:hypothetical protein [Candidatus Phyllobacterium onerii]|uniref:hypothetical protein n=1 Tax=Candidatus Phyllobacterium onerii TaxID=3020828 RepID=UPI002330522C|nr:hypothetical protein [Phyllobacterium sp. IY22]
MFDAAMLEYVTGRAQLEQAVRIGVRNHETVPFFQPLVTIGDGKLVRVRGTHRA